MSSGHFLEERAGQVQRTGAAPLAIECNKDSLAGAVSQRACVFCGSRVVLYPIADALHLVHGPIGCSFYAWLTRRNQTSASGEHGENFMTYALSTDMQESDIIFGGEKKLAAAIQEAYDLFHPKSIAVFATCPVGLIGDDIHAVARSMKEKFGDCNVFAFSCEGYKGVSQSAGHHIATNQIFRHVVGTGEKRRSEQFRINLLGEYNIGGDGFEIDRILTKCGITNIATFSGNSTYDQFATANQADLSCVMCHRSINYVADMIEKKYGVPWIKVNFIGPDSTAKSLRKIAEYFGDQELIDKVEKVIAERMVAVNEVKEAIKAKCEGKRAMLFVGGSRAHHYQELFRDIGMEVIAAGYEFAHRDDYEGRKVLSSIKIDADSRNIEELHVEADPENYLPRKSDDEIKAMEDGGFAFRDYEGMMPEMANETLVIDDISHFESEKLLEMYKPDIFCAGIKEKYVIQKSGIPCKQLHSYDYGGPYAAFEGAINWYEEIDRMVNGRFWSFIEAPWVTASKPELEGAMVSNG